MLAILKGKEILSMNYLDDCLKNKTILPIENYIFKDEIAEVKYKFTLTDTIENVKKNITGVFDKTEFYIWENPELFNDISEIIKVGGGILSEIIHTNSSQIILIKKSDKKDFEKKIMDRVENIYSFELVFQACLQQKMDFAQFKLL